MSSEAMANRMRDIYSQKIMGFGEGEGYMSDDYGGVSVGGSVWINFVKRFAKKNDLTYPEALVAAKKAYSQYKQTKAYKSALTRDRNKSLGTKGKKKTVTKSGSKTSPKKTSAKKVRDISKLITISRKKFDLAVSKVMKEQGLKRAQAETLVISEFRKCGRGKHVAHYKGPTRNHLTYCAKNKKKKSGGEGGLGEGVMVGGYDVPLLTYY